MTPRPNRNSGTISPEKKRQRKIRNMLHGLTALECGFISAGIEYKEEVHNLRTALVSSLEADEDFNLPPFGGKFAEEE